MKLQILLITIISYCSAEITLSLNITVSSEKDKVKITSKGQDSKLVTDTEIQLFNLTSENVRRGVVKELRRNPDNYFFKDPTPYKNLYEKYKWPQVKRSLYVNSAEAIDVITTEVTLNVRENFNNSTDIVKATTDLFVGLENNIVSYWSDTGLPNDNILYNVTINFGLQEFNYTNRWRSNSVKSTKVNYGVSNKDSISINPGQTVVTKLTAFKTILLVQIEYKAMMTGNIILDYERLLGEYHFYAPDIINIMKAAKMNNEILTTEVIEIRCYTDPKLVITDKLTGETLRLHKKIDNIRNMKGVLKKRRKKVMAPVENATSTTPWTVVESTTKKKKNRYPRTLYDLSTRNRI